MTVFEKWVVWVSSLVVTLSGLIYWWMKYLMPSPDGFSVIRHPLQPLILKLHIVTAPLLVFAIGTIAVRHVWRHVTSGARQGRLTGLSTMLAVAPMIVTGYGLQVATDEAWLKVVGLAHIGTGFAYALGLALHQILVHRPRSSGAELIGRGDKRPRAPRKTSARRMPYQ